MKIIMKKCCKDCRYSEESKLPTYTGLVCCRPVKRGDTVIELVYGETKELSNSCYFERDDSNKVVVKRYGFFFLKKSEEINDICGSEGKYFVERMF